MTWTRTHARMRAETLACWRHNGLQQLVFGIDAYLRAPQHIPLRQDMRTCTHGHAARYSRTLRPWMVRILQPKV
eukprot:1454292-Rhodomonas_salina.1